LSFQVLSVCAFTTEAQALALANNTTFGLAGGVIGADEAQVQRVARGLRAGIIFV